MADWRQIQARIRKAKSSSTPAETLAELHQRTRDAMVAFELARFHEKNGDNAEAARWFTTAAQQFRRAQWRVKAEEALTRLGAEIPPRVIEADRAEAVEESTKPEQPESAKAAVEEEEVVELSEQPAESAAAPAASAAGEAPAPGAARKRHRRGRRGGRKHRRQGAPADERAGKERGPAQAAHSSPTPHHGSSAPSSANRPAAPETLPRPVPHEAAQDEPVAETTYEPRGESAGIAASGRARFAEPALSSRMAQLESRLRRLLACSLASLKDADQAPAGPGVLLLSDSDQVTHYYIESCHTLRIGIANLLRGGRGSKEGGRLKQEMAENLGITESRVSKYLADHCVVRWLQLDEGAGELAHFAIAVLHPVVNE